MWLGAGTAKGPVGEPRTFWLLFPPHPVHKSLSLQLQQTLWSNSASGSREVIAAEHLSFPLSLGWSGITEKSTGTVWVGCTTSNKYIFTGDSITDFYFYMYIYLPNQSSLCENIFLYCQKHCRYIYMCIYTHTAVLSISHLELKYTPRLTREFSPPTTNSTVSTIFNINPVWSLVHDAITQQRRTQACLTCQEWRTTACGCKGGGWWKVFGCKQAGLNSGRRLNQ